MNRMSLLRYGLPGALILTAASLQPAAAQLPSVLVPPPPAEVVQTSPPPAQPAPAPPTSAPLPAPVQAAPPPPPPAPTMRAPVAVQAAPLQAPDLFSSEGSTPTGLPSDLWKGASLDLARTVIPLLSAKPLSPAAGAFALRVMSTSAPAPEGAGQDPDLAAARIGAVLSLGDALGARTMLEHTAGVRQNAALSQVAAETDLVLGREDEACGLGDSLAAGKDGPYWRRLRVFCLIRAGDKPGAQLAYDLTTEQAKDETYKRLMGAAVAGAPAGDASLRNGLEYAVSRRLQLDLTPALDKAWAPVVSAVAKDATAPAAVQAAAAALIAKRVNDLSRASTLNPAVRDATLALADNTRDPRAAEALAADGVAGGVESKGALAIYTAAGGPSDGRTRAAFALFDIGRSTGNQARLLDMDGAAVGGPKGDAVLLALWLMADAGEAGPGPVDRARIVGALRRAGLRDDARSYAIEGLLGLKPPMAAAAATAAPAAHPAPKKPVSKPVLRKRRK